MKLVETSTYAPCYARYDPRSLSWRTASTASDLIGQGDNLKLNGGVVRSYLMGSNFPDDSLFLDIPLLPHACSVTFQKSSPTIRTSIQYIPDVSIQDVSDYLFYIVEKEFKDNESLVIPLSGGYDSRLNLLIAKMLGRHIQCYHFKSSTEETKITRDVAKKAGVQVKLLDIPKVVDKNIWNGEQFTLFHSGIYRDSIPKHRGALSSWPGTRPFGHGAECHKGKYYQRLDRFGEDWDRILGYHVNPQIIELSREFPDPTSRLDYIHYQTFIANGYGKRCWYFNQYHDAPFPFLDKHFLSLVFSLPREQKEGGYIVRHLINKIDPDYLNIPFYSCATKTYKEPSLIGKIARHIKGKLKKHQDRMYMNGLAAKEILDQQAGSQVTMDIRRMLRKKSTRPYKRQYCLQLYKYLCLLENRFGVALEKP